MTVSPSGSPSPSPSGGSVRAAPSVTLEAKVASAASATLHAVAPAADAGTMTIAQEIPGSLNALCQKFTLSVVDKGKDPTRVDHSMNPNEIGLVIYKLCQIKGIDPASVTSFSIHFVSEKVTIKYGAAPGTEVEIDLTTLMKGNEERPEVKTFRKLQEETTKIRGFEGRVKHVEFVADARAPFVKTGSLGSRAASDITGPLHLLSLAKMDGAKESKASQDFTASIRDKLTSFRPAGSAAVERDVLTTNLESKSLAKQLHKLQERRKRELKEIVKLVQVKKEALSRLRADEDNRELTQDIKALEKIQLALSIEPIQEAPGEDPTKALEKHIEAMKESGVDLKVAIALVVKALMAEQGITSLTTEQKKQLASQLEKFFVGANIKRTWTDFIKGRGENQMLIERASYEALISDAQKERKKKEFIKSAKQMAADTVALLFNDEKDVARGKTVKRSYMEFAEATDTTTHERDVADITYVTAASTAVSLTGEQLRNQWFSTLGIDPGSLSDPTKTALSGVFNP